MLCSALYFIGAVPFDDIWASQCVAIKEWLDTGRRPLTVKRYGTNLGPWFTFLDKHELHDYVDLSPTGADDFRRIVIWFLYYCAMELKLSESKIQTTIQALQYALKSDGHSLGVFKDASVKLARDAVREDPRIKNAKRTRRKRLPVTFDMLFYLEDLLLGSSHIDDWMTFLGILMAFHFMLRISEYCLDGSSQHAIRCGDVLFLSSDGKVYSPWDPKLSMFEPSYITGAIIDEAARRTRLGPGVTCMSLGLVKQSPSCWSSCSSGALLQPFHPLHNRSSLTPEKLLRESISLDAWCPLCSSVWLSTLVSMKCSFRPIVYGSEVCPVALQQTWKTPHFAESVAGIATATHDIVRTSLIAVFCLFLTPIRWTQRCRFYLLGRFDGCFRHPFNYVRNTELGKVGAALSVQRVASLLWISLVAEIVPISMGCYYSW